MQACNGMAAWRFAIDSKSLESRYCCNLAQHDIQNLNLILLDEAVKQTIKSVDLAIELDGNWKFKEAETDDVLKEGN